jgi:hypothetical protein
MFEQNYGSKTTRWLYWFIGAMAVYALSTLWPRSRMIVWIGAACALLGINIARWEIARDRKGKS